MKTDVKVEFAGAVAALEKFESRGIAATDIALGKIAQLTAAGARQRGGERYGPIEVHRAGAGEYAVVSLQQDGRHIANYNNYGTLASRRPKARRPGTKRDHTKTGIKRKRFLRKPPKRAIVAELLDAVVTAGELSGLDMKKGV